MEHIREAKHQGRSNTRSGTPGQIEHDWRTKRRISYLSCSLAAWAGMNGHTVSIVSLSLLRLGSCDAFRRRASDDTTFLAISRWCHHSYVR